MAVEIDLLNSNSVNNIDTNFERVQTALQDVISRSGSTPNQMNADLDMNSNDILNISTIDVDSILINGIPIGQFNGTFKGEWAVDVSYLVNDVVRDTSGNLWIAERNNIGIPVGENDDWTLFMPGATVADGAITTAKLADGSVTNSKLATNSVTSDKILNDTILEPDLSRPLSAKTGALFTYVSDLIADKTLSYSNMTTGDTIKAEGFTYIVAASGAVDHDLITANGLKLYALLNTDGTYNVKQFGSSGSSLTTTATTVAASTNVTLAAAQDFRDGQRVRINHAGPAFAINPPTSLVVTPTGATGATSYAYTIASLDAAGGVGAAIANTTIANGNATLSYTNYNVLTWTAPAGTAPNAYAIYGRTAGSRVLLAIVGALTPTWTDFGSASISAAPDWLPSTPQVTSLPSWLVTNIVSGQGTTSLVLSTAAGSSVTTSPIYHDDTASIQASILKGSTVIPAGTYRLSGDINFPSSRDVWVQEGATINNIGGRFTGYLPGGGDINLRIDGTMAFLATFTAPSKNGTAGWEYNTTWHNRGIIEFGGDLANPSHDIHITGTGLVYSDYNYTSIPRNYSSFHSQMNRKGICLFNCNDSSIEGLSVNFIYGEAVYAHGPAGSRNIKFYNNSVQNVAFNGLNFNYTGAVQNFVMQNNYVLGARQGIEASVGFIDQNTIVNVDAGFLTGAGGGGGPLRISRNNVVNSKNAYNVSFSPSVVENVFVMDNIARNTDVSAFIFGNISTFTVQDNIDYVHSFTGTGGYGFLINSTCGNGYVNGNIVRAPGVASSGNVVNNAGAAVTVGTNPVF